MKSNIAVVLTAIGVMFIVGLLALLIILEKPVDTYIGSLTTLSALLVANGILGSRIDKVSKNVNGNTTRLMNENEQLRKALGIQTGPIDTGFQPTDKLMSEETIMRIRKDRDALPSHRKNES